MTTHRRYTFETKLQKGHEGATRIVNQACERHWWFTEPEVTTSGDLVISFVVRARDQWWAHRRATALAVDAAYAAGGTEKDVPFPDWVKLPPHENRGYNRGRGVDAGLAQG